MISKFALLEILRTKKIIFSKLDLTNSQAIKISSYDFYYAKITADFCREVLKRMGCTVSLEKNPITSKKWTVLSSPFGHKTARTQFEKRTVNYVLRCSGIDKEGYLIAKWYFSLQAPPTVSIS